MKHFTILFLLFTISLTAQIKGVVVDQNNNPIPYASIWVQNENVGTTSEENGTFSIETNKDKNLIVSALGYEKKTIKAAQNLRVILATTDIKIEEVVVIGKRLDTKEIEIGKNRNEIYQAFDNGPRIDVKFFPYVPKYKKTKFIKKVTIFTDSKIENSTIKLHFYAVDQEGFPGEELLQKDFLVNIKQGVIKHQVNVTNLNLKMPQKGLFVGYEKLIIESNKLEKTITDSNTKIAQVKKTYYPFVLYNYVERQFLFTFSGGKWNRKSNSDEKNPTQNISVYEPAINLILSN